MEWVNLKKIREQKSEERYEAKVKARKDYYKKLRLITEEDRGPYMEKARALLSGKVKGQS